MIYLIKITVNLRFGFGTYLKKEVHMIFGMFEDQSTKVSSDMLCTNAISQFYTSSIDIAIAIIVLFPFS